MALAVGTEAPDFTLLDTEKNPITLSSFRGRKVLLAFFPAAFTGTCTAELCSFQNNIQRLNNAGVQVLAVSADLPFSNGGFAQANSLEFPILSDWTMATINAYDVPFPNFAGIQGLTRSARATFIIDESGLISYVDVTEHPGLEPNYDKIYAHL
jgi:peroxiredoxin